MIHGKARQAPQISPLAFVKNLRLNKNRKQFGVQHPAGNLGLHDVEGALGGNRPLVRAVLGCKRVEDVADGHHPGLYRDIWCLHLPRVAGAVQLFVVTVGDVRNPAQTWSTGYPAENRRCG